MNITFEAALIFYKNGKFDNAEVICKKLLEQEPESFEVINLLGAIFLKQEKYREAITQFNKAIDINPKHHSLFNNLGIAYKENNEYHKAIECLEKAIKIKHDYAEAFNNLGTIYKKLEEYLRSSQNYKLAIENNPNYAEAYYNLGILYSSTKNYKEAINNANKAINLNNNYIDAYKLRADTNSLYSKNYQAIKDYNKLKKLDKKNKIEYDNKIFLEKILLCDWSNYNSDIKEFKKFLKNTNQIVSPFRLLSLTDSLETIKNNTKNYIKENFNTSVKNYNFINSKKKKITIGYYSPDFRNHAVSYLIKDLFRNHNKNNFEIVGFNFNKYSDDSITDEISTTFDKFFNIKNMTDEEIISKSRELKIDIAVDLCGLTADNKIKIFTERIAPIQINFLGYPGTTGSFMDYIIADKTLITDSDQDYYFEKIIYMPQTYQPYSYDTKKIEKNNVKKKFNLPESGFIYTCLNNNFKINPFIFDCWMKILKKTQNTYLLLLTNNDYYRENLLLETSKRNIKTNRVIFSKYLDYTSMLERYQACDLFLDTFPYGAHTTAREALTMGLPLLTLKGNSFQSRVSSSLLNSLKVPELITNDIKSYEKLAINLANNPDKLREIQEKIFFSVKNSEAFKIDIFTKNLEKAYQNIYYRYHQSLLPENIYID